MIYRILFLSIITLFTFQSKGVSQIELIEDYTIGSQDTRYSCMFFTSKLKDGTCSEVFDNTIFIPIEQGPLGTELFTVKDDQYEWSLDILAGPPSSFPRDMTNYKGKMYFYAQAPTETGPRELMYETDGTIEGTVKAFDFESKIIGGFSQIVVSNDSIMYFAHARDLYAFNGDTLVNLDLDFSLNSFEGSGFTNWCKLDTGLMVMQRVDNDFYTLFEVNGLEITEIAALRINWIDSPPQPFALRRCHDGFVFSLDGIIEETFNGVYRYFRSTDSFEKLNNQKINVISNVDNKSCIFSVVDSFILVNEEFPLGKTISKDRLGTSNGYWNRRRFNDNLLFNINGGFSNYALAELSSNEVEPNMIIDVEDLSLIIGHNELSYFFANSISENSNITLYQYDHLTQELEEYFVFDEEVDIINNLMEPVVIFKNHLYFFGQIDDSIGSELYKINLSGSTNITNVLRDSSLKLKNISNSTYAINSTKKESYHVRIYSINGSLLSSFDIENEIPFKVDNHGLLIVNVSTSSYQKSFKVFNY